MDKILSLKRPFGAASTYHAPHFNFCRLQDGGLAVLDVFEGIVIVLDQNFQDRKRIRFRQRFDSIPRPSIPGNSHPILQTHCMSSLEESVVIFDPTDRQLKTVSLHSGLIHSCTLPFNPESISHVSTHRLIALAHYQTGNIHLITNEGRLLESIRSTSFGQGANPYSLGRLVVSFGNEFVSVRDQGAGIVECSRLSTGQEPRWAFIAKNRDVSPISQFSAKHANGHWVLQITWPSHPLGICSIAAAGNSLHCLAGSGQELVQLDKVSGHPTFYKHPHIGSDFEQPLLIESADSRLVIGTDRGAIWFLDQSDLMPLSAEEFSRTINRDYLSYGGISAGPATGFVINPADIRRNLDFWKSFSGSYLLRTMIRPGGRISKIETLSASSADRAKSLENVLADSSFISTGESFGSGISLEIEISINPLISEFARQSHLVRP